MISQSRVRELFDHKANGSLIRKTNGMVVGTNSPRGYLYAGVDGKSYLVHRLIWLWHNGSFPENELDHIDRDKRNNRIENMRDVTHQQNQINSGLQKNNTSGMKGVSLRHGKWQVSLKRDGIKKFVGSFIDFSEAAKARLRAEEAWEQGQAVS